MMMNPYRSVTSVSNFNFRGASVKVIALTNMVEPKSIDSLRQDALAFRSMLVKYNGMDAVNPFKRAMRDARERATLTNYVVEISMGGISRSFDTRNRHSMNFRYKIRDLRKSIIANLRDERKRYRQASVTTLLPSSISYAYNGAVTNRFNYYGSHRVGFVHAEAGSILRAHETRMSTRLFEAVRPMTSERHVGIEIECGVNVSRERLAFLLRPFVGYVMVKGDGSVNVPNRQSVELNVCAPVSRYKEILKGITDILNSPEVNARVNKTCGLHVHLDVREWRNDFNALSDKYARLISVQGILYSMQPKSRQDNTYCVKSKSRSIVRGASRYQGINAQSIWKYTTIETRLHAGTTDYVKITNWCDLLIGVMYSSGTVPKRALTKIDSIAKYFPVTSSMLQYIAQRVRQFANGSEEIESSEAA